MKVVVGNRDSGVTTNILLDAAKHGGTIVTTSTMQADGMTHKAKSLGVDCPKTISVLDVLNDIKDGNYDRYYNEQLYVDNAGLVLNELLNHVGIKGKVVEISLSMDGIGN